MNRVHRPMRAAVVALLLVQLSACATFRQFFTDVTPQTVEEGIAASHVALANANDSLSTLIEPCKDPAYACPLSKAAAQRIGDGLDAARKTLNSATSALKSDQTPMADNYLKVANEHIKLADHELAGKKELLAGFL